MPVPTPSWVTEWDHHDMSHADGDLLVASRAAVGLGGGDRLDGAQLGGLATQRIGDKARRNRAASKRAAPRSITRGHASSIAELRRARPGRFPIWRAPGPAGVAWGNA